MVGLLQRAVHPKTLLELIRPLDGGPRSKIPYGEHPRIGEGNVLFTLNPVNPDLLARAANTFAKCDGAADAHISAFSLFLLDIDAVRHLRNLRDRPREGRSGGTRRRDRQLVRYSARSASSALTSGSGEVLVPTIPYGDVTAAAANAKLLLELLDRKFSTDGAKVDTSVYNPSRVCKLYGSLAIKGSNISERPHRYATINLEEIPDDVDLFGVLKDKHSMPSVPNLSWRLRSPPPSPPRSQRCARKGRVELRDLVPDSPGRPRRRRVRVPGARQAGRDGSSTSRIARTTRIPMGITMSAR